jgi:hypothetical protein
MFASIFFRDYYLFPNTSHTVVAVRIEAKIIQKTRETFSFFQKEKGNLFLTRTKKKSTKKYVLHLL